MGFVPTSTVDAINFSVFAVVLLSTIFRVLARHYLVPKVGADDVLACISTIFFLAYIVILHYEISALEWLYGSLANLPPERHKVETDEQWEYYTRGIRLLVFDNITQLWAISFAKLSLLAFYRRITPFKSHNVVLYILDAMIVGNGIAHTLVTALSTRPIPCQYNFGAYRESCHWVLETILALSLNSAFQILIDILACTLPWVVLWKIKIGRGNRVKLVLMYSTGLVSMVFSGVRIYAINYKSETTKTWLEAQFKFDLWSVIEPFAAILCVNIPGLVAGACKIWSMYHPDSFRSESDTYGSYGKGSGRKASYTTTTTWASISKPGRHAGGGGAAGAGHYRHDSDDYPLTSDLADGHGMVLMTHGLEETPIDMGKPI